MLILTETKWRQGGRFRSLIGLTRFHKERSVGNKKGDGIANFIRKNIAAYSWEGGEIALNSVTTNESLCVIVQELNGPSTAICCVYMGVNTTSNEAWNDQIEESLQSDITQLSGEGHRILLKNILSKSYCMAQMP